MSKENKDLASAIAWGCVIILVVALVYRASESNRTSDFKERELELCQDICDILNLSFLAPCSCVNVTCARSGSLEGCILRFDDSKEDENKTAAGGGFGGVVGNGTTVI